MNIEEALSIIEGMSDRIGVAKQSRLRAIVARASLVGKLDSINLGKLAKLPLKQMKKYKDTL